MKTFLIIDDDNSDLQWMRSCIEAQGKTVITAGSAKQGLELLQHNSVDAIICDYVLYESDGVSFFDQIKEVNAKKYLVTQYRVHPEVMEQAKEVGVNEVISKTMFQAKDFSTEERLEEITNIFKKLRELEDIAHYTNNNGISYDCVRGKCEGRNLMHIEKIAVQDAFLDPDTELIEHYHEKEDEIFIIYEGDMAVKFMKNDIMYRDQSVINKGIITVPAGTSHIASSVKGCRLIAITVPASKAYPI